MGIGDARFVEGVYAKEEKVNFYISQGFTNAEIEALVSGVTITGDVVEIIKELGDNEKKMITVIYSYKINRGH